jgi:hypothetical protein
MSSGAFPYAKALRLTLCNLYSTSLSITFAMFTLYVLLAVCAVWGSVNAQGTSCDTSATGGDSTWRSAMLAELTNQNSEAYTMINAMCHQDTPAANFC